MEEDWERLLDGALEKKRARAKAVKFTEFNTGPGEAEEEGPSPPADDEDEAEHLREQTRLLGEKVQELLEENKRLRERLEKNSAGAEGVKRPKRLSQDEVDAIVSSEGGEEVERPEKLRQDKVDAILSTTGDEEVERLKRELAEARAIIRSIEEAYKLGRRRPRR